MRGLADAVDEDGVAGHLGAEAGRGDVDGVAEAEHPVDVVVHQVDRALAAGLAGAVLGEDRLADPAERVGGDRGLLHVDRRYDRARAHGRDRRRAG